MKSFTKTLKDIARQSNILRQLTDSESTKLKSVLLSMYKDIDNLCRNNNLDLILVGGTALGAARHKGFIPWDDDLDVALKRDHYDTFIKLIEDGKLSSDYEFTYPSSQRDSKNNFIKIYKKNTRNAEIHDLGTPFPKGIYIDIFPIENAIKPGFINNIHSYLLRMVSYISGCVLLHKYPNRILNNLLHQTPEGKTWFKINKLVGFSFSFISHKRWIYFYETLAKSKRKTGYLTIPAGRGCYSGETLPEKIFYPTKELDFEDYKAKVPNDIDAYLRNLYGDYLMIPSADKQERHLIVDIEFK